MTHQQVDNYGIPSQRTDNYGARGYEGFGNPETEPRERRTPGYDGPPPREGRYRPPTWVRAIGIVLIVFIALILACGVGTGGLALLAYSTPAVSTSSSQTFAVTGTPTIVVHASAADVTLITGGANQVAMHVTKSARSITSGLARQVLDDMVITATQSGDTITIEERDQSLGLQAPVQVRQLHLDLTVPATTNLNVTLNAGNLTADQVRGTVSIVENAGDVLFRDAQIADASIRTNAGTMRLDHVTLSGNATLAANAGNIDFDGTLASKTTLDVRLNAGNATLTLPAATSAHLDARTEVGDVSVIGWPLAVSRNVTQAFASGDLSPNPTGNITIHADTGNVTVMAQ